MLNKDLKKDNPKSIVQGNTSSQGSLKNLNINFKTNNKATRSPSKHKITNTQKTTIK